MEQSHIKAYPSKRGWAFLMALVSVLLVLFLLGWFPRLSNTEKIDALAASDPLPRVTLMQVHPNEEPITLVLPSSAQAWHITPIWSRVNGYLIQYLVDIGDRVKKGDLLAEIDTPETDQQVAQAQATLTNSIAERDIAKITNERWQRLWKKNSEAVAKQEVDQYQANYQAAEATVVANEKNLARFIYQQQFKYMYAPFDGIITQRNIDIGSLIYGTVNNTTQELFQIAQTHTIRFFVEVPQTYFRQIQEGIETEVTVQEFPGKIFKGMVTRYAKALDPISRTLLTEIDVENPEEILYAGIYGQVKFLMKPDTINFIIPATALIIRDDPPQVAIVNENHIVSLKSVRIGRDYGKQIEITFGLQSNAYIIVNPSDRIQEGVQVKVL